MATHEPVEVHTGFARAFNAGDLDGLMALYEPEAVLGSESGEVAEGTDAIREALKGYLASGGKIQLETRYAIQSGDLALLSASWQLTGGTGPDGQPVEIRARSTEVARRQADGSWRYVVDHPFGAT